MLRIILNAIEAIGFKNDGISDGLNVGLNLSELDKDVLTLIASNSFITIAVYAMRLLSIHYVHRNPLRYGSATFMLRTWHPCLFSNEIHFVQSTSFQQLKEVHKKSRATNKFLIH